MSGKLYLVGTPIGNLGDISPRAAETLADVDFIAAEDTRVTMKLLSHLGIKKPLVSYYEHNRAESGEKIISRLIAGETCAIVTDAGMPAISDPGEDLVRQCGENGIETVVVPGPSAVVSAVALSGLPTGRFTFEGFLSVTKKSRFEHLDSLRQEKRTMVFYEAPHKLAATLRDMLEVLGDRRIALCRELTKIHEETIRTTLSAAARFYAENPAKGEFVIVIEGASETAAPTVTLEEAVEMVLEMKNEGMSLKDAAKRCSQRTGLPKNAIYDAALKR
ncbi:MAG: 16S rRNA (cytidine(1402)-2'-O)-methyltransferase [Oscillospiraceae bacterium]